MRISKARCLFTWVVIFMGLIILPANGQDVSPPQILPITLGNASQVTELLSLQIDTRSVRNVVFSPDSQLFIILKRYDASIDLWEAAARQEWFDNALEVWNTQTGERLYSLNGQTDKITLLEFQPDSNLLASASDDNSIRIWNAATGEQIWSVTIQGDLISDLTFSLDGQLLAFVDGSGFPESERNRVRIIEMDTLQEQEPIEQPFAFVTAFSPDNSQLVVGGSDGKAGLWQLNNPDSATYTPIQEGDLAIPILDVGFSHNGELVVVDNLVNLNVWSIVDKTSQVVYDNNVDIDFTRRRYADVYAQARANAGFQLFNIVDAQEMAGWQTRDKLGALRRINADESILISVNSDKLLLWDTETGNELANFSHEDVFDATFSEDGRYISSWSGSNGLLKIWSIPAETE